MEPFTVVTSVIALVQLTELTLKLANKHMGLGPSRHNDTELLRISQSVYAFHGILQSLQTHLRICEEDEGRLQTLDRLLEPLERCKEALGLISDRLKNAKFIGKYLVGERFDRKLKSALLVLEEAQKLVQLSLVSDQHIIVNAVEHYLRTVAEDVRDIHGALNENGKRLADHEDICRKRHKELLELKLSYEQDQIIRWLQYTDPSTNHNAACEKHEPSTGRWLLQSNSFSEWEHKLNGLLWLHGIPGCGKTILTSTVVEHVRALCEGNAQSQYVFFYFDFNDSKKMEVAGFLRSSLTQLASQNSKTLKEVEDLYIQNDRGAKQPDKERVLSTLLSALQSAHRTYLIIDALDECSQREEMLDVISNIHQRCSSQISILVASRDEYDIREKLTTLKSDDIGIQDAVVDSDIRLHVNRCLIEDKKLSKWPIEVKKEIEDVLVEGAHGMFRWVVCQVDVLRRCPNLPVLRRRLKELPETLDQTYERILLDIPKEHQPLARSALQWLALSLRPMSLGEIAEAIVVDTQQQYFSPQDRLFDIHTVVEICSSLVTLSEEIILDPFERRSEGPRWTGDQGRKLSLAHYSVKEYLISDRMHSGPASAFAFTEVQAHEYMEEACLIYLLHFDKPNSLYEGVWLKFAFLYYSAEYWYRHHRANSNISTKIIDLMMALFDIGQGAQFINWLKIWDPIEASDGILCPIHLNRSMETANTPLCYASRIGVLDVVERMLAGGADVNTTAYSDGKTALHRASAAGYLEVVERLLAAGADVNITDYCGRTALRMALFKGHLDIVERLLAAGADVNTVVYSDSTTVMHRASAVGYLEVVERLLAAGADVNITDYYGRTALWIASSKGHLEIVERLLAAGADVNTVTYSDSTTAAHRASAAGYLKVLGRLLAAGADVNITDYCGRTALWMALSQGHLEIVKRLLTAGANVNVNAVDGYR